MHLVEGIIGGTDVRPTFEEGLSVQRVLDAVERSAHRESGWVSVTDDARV